MALASAVQYTVRLHVDKNSADAGFNSNIVFDGIEVENFNDGSFASNSSPTWAVTTIAVGGNTSGTELDSFVVKTAYPKSYTLTDPGTLRINDHIIEAFNGITAIINQSFPPTGYAALDRTLVTSNFPAGSPTPVISTFTIAGGTGYPTLTNFVTKLTGGSGYGTTALITSSGGTVTSVVILNPGTGYLVGDVLSANLGVRGDVYPAVPGTGFTVTITAVVSPITNTTYA